MLDLITRVLRHPIDYSGVLSAHRLTLIKHDDLGHLTHRFIFKRPAGMAWKPGQHALFTLPRKGVSGKKWRAFSVASAPAEDVIMLATTVPPAPNKPSDFKHKLLALQPGDSIMMFGPYGEFHTEHATKTMVGIAGGIGITPLRALIADLKDKPDGSFRFELIYGGKDGFFAFKDELDAWAAHPNLTITYVNTPDAVNAAIDDACVRHGNAATFFISGSPGMITAVRTRLTNHRVTHIVNDPFKGY